MDPCEFVIRRKPLSAQTKNRSALQLWKSLVRLEAEKAWAGRPVLQSELVHVSLVYLYREGEELPLDADNIIKPIQDALEGPVLSDDILVSDVESHRRLLGTAFDPSRVPPLLGLALYSSEECVYVSVRRTRPLEDFL